jgi:Ycf4
MDNRKTDLVRRDFIIGSKRFSNYFWSILLLFGGTGFLLAGFSSYFKINLLPFADSTELIFIPQGIVMIFYGVVAISLSLYIILTIIWDVGSGYNEFNKIDELIRIARNGFPGKNRQILLVYPFNNIKCIKLSIQDGINPKRVIYLCTKDQRQIPLTQVEQPRSLLELEIQASELAKFLEVNLEGI